jgi:hypothetical protein
MGAEKIDLGFLKRDIGRVSFGKMLIKGFCYSVSGEIIHCPEITHRSGYPENGKSPAKAKYPLPLIKPALGGLTGR